MDLEEKSEKEWSEEVCSPSSDLAPQNEPTLNSAPDSSREEIGQMNIN